MTPSELSTVRRAYAKQIMADMRARDDAVEAAFAQVRREDFLGPGPWPIHRYGGYVMTPEADPVYLYTNDVVGIDPVRKLNNGQPSLHAYLMSCAAPRPGEHVVHIGAGVGYYSAILSRLVGSTGRLTAIEYEADLAARTKANLADDDIARVLHADGTTAAFDPADIIYVNAGATRPANLWLDRLRPGGRLVLPLTTAANFGGAGPFDMARHGAVFLITRRPEDFTARRISQVGIYPCAGLRDDASERALAAAFARSDGSRVTHLVRHGDWPEERYWLRGSDWGLMQDIRRDEATDKAGTIRLRDDRPPFRGADRPAADNRPDRDES